MKTLKILAVLCTILLFTSGYAYSQVTHFTEVKEALVTGVPLECGDINVTLDGKEISECIGH